jgi:iron complex transport system substrate-binding protein
MNTQRIVSFLPSVTELLYELGVQDQLYGVTHECLYPEEAKSKPRVIDTVFDGSKMSSPEIDKITCSLMSEGKDIFVLQEDNFKQARPDLIFSQTTCEVCAAHTDQVKHGLQILEKKPQLYSIDPHNLDEILESVMVVAKLVQKEKQGKQLQDSLKKRIEFVKNQSYPIKPKVLAIEWIWPFFTSGHWVPQMIQFAGGQNQISKTGEHSRRLEFEEIKNSDPDIIVMMPCGFDTQRTVSEYDKFLKNNSSWNSLRAVKNKKVYAVDANAYFSKPSIRTIDGLEILGKIFHPEKFDQLHVPENSFLSTTN